MQDRKDKKIARLQHKVEVLTEENDLLKARIRNYEEQINNESYQYVKTQKENFEKELEEIRMLKAKLQKLYELQTEFVKKERKAYMKKTNKAIQEFKQSLE